jgi:hypothetical protein
MERAPDRDYALYRAFVRHGGHAPRASLMP